MAARIMVVDPATARTSSSHHFGAIAYHLGRIVRDCHQIDDLSGSTHDGNELESLSFWLGMKSVTLLALGLYLGSALALRIRTRAVVGQPAAATSGDLLFGEISRPISEASTTCGLAGIAGGVLLVGLLDVPSLWSVAKVRDYLLDGSASAHIGLLLNRFRKLPGFSEDEIQNATKSKIMWKIPNQYAAVSSAIDRGVPLIEQNHSELARTFTNLAHMLAEVEVKEKRKARAGSLFGIA